MKPPYSIVVMGVAGCGKSLVGQSLATALHVPFIEGDRYHPRENIELMSAGIPLDDQHRQGWLQTLAGQLATHTHAGQPGCVLACSALKRRYRDIFRQTNSHTLFIHLAGTAAQIVPRMQQRTHFMPESLLKSQFNDLEAPAADEHALTLDISASPEELTRQVLDYLAKQP